MRRVLVYCQWKKEWWAERGPIRQRISMPLPDDAQGPRGPVLSPELEEGLVAFAAEQGAMEDRIRTAWTHKWAGARELARPIIAAVMGDDEAPMPIPEGTIPSIIELDLRDDEDDAGNPDDDD